MKAKWDHFQFVNALKRINRIVQIVLAISFILGLNYLGAKHFWRTDLTRKHLYSLSAETKARIQQIDSKNPITITVSLAQEGGNAYDKLLFKYVYNLLKEYEYVGKNRIKLRVIDLFKQKAEADKIITQYNLKNPRMVLLECGDRHDILLPSDLLEFENTEITAFKGEQAITTSIIEITNIEPRTLYFIFGHGEMRLDDVSPLRGLSNLRQQLELRGFKLNSIDLSEFKSIPQETSLVVVVSPQGPFYKDEVEKLRSYLDESAGRIILLVDPAINHGLDDLLFEWGLCTEDMIVVDKGINNLSSEGDLQIRKFATHPITKFLLKNQIRVEVGLSRPVLQDPDAYKDERLEFTTLMTSSESSWAERAYRTRYNWVYNPISDILGPISQAMISERKVSPQLGFDIRGGRLIVFGLGDLISNHRINSVGNQILFFNTVNWCLDQKSLLGIRPRKIKKFKLSIEQQKQIQLTLILLCIPGTLVLIGIVVFWIRK
jgi:ABC-type uncharacterized transport system involved in gliding motility auxiliary subunit